jgi:hypothetical protein
MQGVAAKNDASYDLSRTRASVTGQTTIAASTATTSLPNGRIVAAAREAAPIDDLGREHHRAAQRDPATTPQPRQRRRERGRERQLLDLPIELIAPLQFSRKQRVIFAKAEPVGGHEPRGVICQLLEPAQGAAYTSWCRRDTQSRGGRET